MALKLRRLSHALGAEVCYINVAAPMSEAVFGEIYQAFLGNNGAKTTSWHGTTAAPCIKRWAISTRRSTGTWSVRWCWVRRRVMP